MHPPLDAVDVTAGAALVVVVGSLVVDVTNVVAGTVELFPPPFPVPTPSDPTLCQSYSSPSVLNHLTSSPQESINKETHLAQTHSS